MLLPSPIRKQELSRTMLNSDFTLLQREEKI
jgi:hypothetical protein